MAKYVSKKGDTLKKLAKRYGVTRKYLRDLNPDTQFGNKKKGFNKLDPNSLLKLGKGIGVSPQKAQLLQDPKYAAFLRGFDYDRDKLRSDFLEFQDQQAVDLSRQEPIYARQWEDASRGIDRSADQRGTFRSGQRLLERGRAKSGIDQTRQRFIDQQGDAREEARRGKKEAIMGLKRDKMNEKLGARERLTMRDANTRYGY